MPRSPNPYIAGPSVSGSNFYGREDIFRFVQNTFSSPYQNVVVLWGQRRMGKTSVLHELPSRLSPEFHPIYFDLQDKAQQRLNDLLYDLAREIAGSLNLDSPPRDDFLHDDGHFHKRFLPQVYQTLGRKRLLLMFDEFDILDIPREELADDAALRAFFPYLRRALMHDEQLAFIFVVGRRLDELDELLQSTFKMAKTASVSFLEEAEARRLIAEPASDILRYDEEAVDRVISITACHPYLAQLVCFELFGYMEAVGRTRVTAGDVEEVICEAIAAGSAGLTWLWKGLPTAERFVLSAVAHAAEEGRVATQDEISRILKEYRVPFSGPELTQAPDTLIRWGLLRRTVDGYEFIVELLRRWILSEHSLEQAKRELESVSPRAARLYERASEFHQVGELDRAIRLYERALGTNPHHMRARLGLAQALFERGRIEEAITEFEGAYMLDSVRARDGLIGARQAWAGTLEKTGRMNEADQEYKTILSIAPDDPRVKEWVASRWTARGKKYLAEDRYEDAIAEYEKATVLKVPGAQEGLIATRRAWGEALEREGRVKEADQQYEAILSIASDDDKLKEWVAGCWMARGKEYLRGARYKEAVAEYDKAFALSVSGAREGLIAARRTWVEALEREDKAGEADQQYEAILRIAPDDESVREWVVNSLIRRGDRYLEEGRYDEVSEAYDQAESIQPEKQQALAQRRHRLKLAPDYDRAMRAYEAEDWATVEKEWAELYKKDRDYVGREGKTVAVLLAEAIEKRVGIAKRRQRRLILVSSGLAVVVAALILWLGWGSVVTSGQIGAGRLALVIRPPTPITSPTPAPLPTEVPTTLTIAAHTATPLTAATGTPTSTPTPTPTPTQAPTETPMPTPTPIIIVITATPAPTPTPIVIVVTATPSPTPIPTPSPTPRFPAPRLIGPENEYRFFECDAARVILQWEPVGPMEKNDWYQVIVIFFKSGEIQYGGARLKETKWQVPAYFYGQADQPKRAYHWDVTVIQVNKDPDGNETIIERSPPSETWTFYWP